ncbi:MAG: hypothetical protein LC744_00800 [Chloroflexi bacterium]|nr:hypothetical protein [Chloroflexota bacterium]
MTTRTPVQERVYRRLLRLYPAEFSGRFSNEMTQLFSDQLRDARTRGVSHLGGLALAVGSLLAIIGIHRLGLTSADNPTILGTLAVAGVGLNGIGWILLGVDVATRRRAPEVEPGGVPPRD